MDSIPMTCASWTIDKPGSKPPAKKESGCIMLLNCGKKMNIGRKSVTMTCEKAN